jgi:beta-alanine degradation protein BauB
MATIKRRHISRGGKKLSTLLVIFWTLGMIFIPGAQSQTSTPSKQGSAGASPQDSAVNLPPASKVEIDNQQVRVVRRYHQPHEKVPLHSHAEGVVVYLTEVRETSTNPDGTSHQVTHHAGDVIWSPAHTHSLENLADTPIEVIEIELKSAPSGSVISSSHKLPTDTWSAALAK